jgi:hypothetical protein
MFLLVPAAAPRRRYGTGRRSPGPDKPAGVHTVAGPDMRHSGRPATARIDRTPRRAGSAAAGGTDCSDSKTWWRRWWSLWARWAHARAPALTCQQAEGSWAAQSASDLCVSSSLSVVLSLESRRACAGAHPPADCLWTLQSPSGFTRPSSLRLRMTWGPLIRFARDRGVAVANAPFDSRGRRRRVDTGHAVKYWDISGTNARNALAG